MSLLFTNQIILNETTFFGLCCKLNFLNQFQVYKNDIKNQKCGCKEPKTI